MVRRINLNSPQVRERQRQVATYGNQTPLSSTAVERGTTRWLSGSFVSIEGILDVAGTFNVSGTSTFSGALTIAGPTGITGDLTIQGTTDITGQLNVTGPTTLDGVTEIGGDTTITGTLDVTGPMSTKGTLSVEGVTTLKNDLNVTTGGKIKAGNLEIEPTAGGQINFTGGALSSGLGGLDLSHTDTIRLLAPLTTISTQSKPASELTAIGVDSSGGIYRISP